MVPIFIIKFTPFIHKYHNMVSSYEMLMLRESMVGHHTQNQMRFQLVSNPIIFSFTLERIASHGIPNAPIQ
jgi:hypothetical protein